MSDVVVCPCPGVPWGAREGGIENLLCGVRCGKGENSIEGV